AVSGNGPSEHERGKNRHRCAADMPRTSERIALVNVPTDSVTLIAKYKTLRRSDLIEVLNRIDTYERAGGTILFTRIRLTFCARRIERRSFTKVALDSDGIVGRRGRRRPIDFETENFPERRCEAGRRRGRIARHHRDGVVRTLRRAVETTNTRRRVDVDLSMRIAKDRSGRTTSHTLRIRTVHTNLRHERVLQTFLSDRRRPLNLNPAPQQTRLTMHLVTRERTVATPDAEIHVHDEHVRPFDDSRHYLFFGGFECVQIRKRVDRERQRTSGSRER